MENSKILWTDHTFNPWEGCTKVSPGCAHCFAEARNKRFNKGINWGPGAPRRRTSLHNWNQPLKWNRERGETLQRLEGTGYTAILNHRPRVFCGSLCDWLDDEVPIEWLADLLALVHQCQNLDWLLLTKRPQNWEVRIGTIIDWSTEAGNEAWHDAHTDWLWNWMFTLARPKNVWIGTTVENQEMATQRIPELLAIPAKVRFLSMEPLLGAVDLRLEDCWLPGDCYALKDRLYWVICGGESGPDARPMHPEWARGLRDQCQAAGVPFLFKQWGEWIAGDHVDQLPDHEPRNICKLALDGTQANSVTMPSEKRAGMKTVVLVGKDVSGRLLDGIEHTAFPL